MDKRWPSERDLEVGQTLDGTNRTNSNMETWILLIVAISTLAQEPCERPLVPKGTCSLLRHCPSLANITDTIPIGLFLESYGGCEKKEGNVRFCCPVSSFSLPSLPTAVSPRPIILPGTNSNATCPRLYERIGGQCLFIPDIGANHMDWASALAHCSMDAGRQLAVPKDIDAVATYLFDGVFYLEISSVWYWVGANDFETPNVFKWTNGDLVKENIGFVQPLTGSPGKRCLYINEDGLGQADCAASHWYICEDIATR